MAKNKNKRIREFRTLRKLRTIIHSSKRASFGLQHLKTRLFRYKIAKDSARSCLNHSQIESGEPKVKFPHDRCEELQLKGSLNDFHCFWPRMRCLRCKTKETRFSLNSESLRNTSMFALNILILTNCDPVSSKYSWNPWNLQILSLENSRKQKTGQERQRSTNKRGRRKIRLNKHTKAAQEPGPSSGPGIRMTPQPLVGTTYSILRFLV